jgi:FdhD protein
VIQKEFPITRYDHGKPESRMDRVICESWLSVYLNNHLLTEIPVTDRDIPDLVTGILYTEGYLSDCEVPHIKIEGTICRVTLDKAVQVRTLRDLVDCASSRMDLDEIIFPVLTEFYRTPEEIFTLMSDFQNLPSIYHETGGVHMAAFARDNIEFWADDISRRNAVDKVIGKGFREGADMTRGVLITSGRISSDMVLRMLKIGIPVIISLSAPTDKALELADSYGVTVCGFVRGLRMNIYTHKERLGF